MTSSLPVRPNGLAELEKTFGSPLKYVNKKSTWENITLESVSVKYALDYAFGAAVIHTVRAHKLIVHELVDTLALCTEAGVRTNRLKYGGCYCWRPIGGGHTLSTHTWGIAVDIEPIENPRDKVWVDDGKMLDPRIIKIFTDRGWFWGGNFHNRKDPMHFQWCTGY